MYVKRGISAFCGPPSNLCSRSSIIRAPRIERDATALGERRQGRCIVGRADGRKRRCEQLLAHLVGRGEATVEIEDCRFGQWPLAAGWGTTNFKRTTRTSN